MERLPIQVKRIELLAYKITLQDHSLDLQRTKPSIMRATRIHQKSILAGWNNLHMLWDNLQCREAPYKKVRRNTKNN